VLDVLDFPYATQAQREERMARAGVPPERTREAVLVSLEASLIREVEDQLSLAAITKDAFRALHILRD